MKFFRNSITIALIGVLSFNAMAFGYDATTGATQKETTPPKETLPVSPKKKTENNVIQKPQEMKPVHETKASFHIVKKGDTLSKIAKMHKLNLSSLLKLNPSIKNINRIYVGQKIIVKSGETTLTIKNQNPPQTPAPVEQKPVTLKVPLKSYTPDNGVYRGSYIDGGVQQVGLEFTIHQGVIENAKFRALTYKGINYLKPSLEREKNLKKQYDSLLQGILGKSVEEARQLLQTPEKLANTIKSDTDALTGATLRSQKISSALQDGLNRSPYTSKAKQAAYDDGVYRGTFVDGGQEQVGVEFTILDNKVSKIAYNTLAYKEGDYFAADANEKIVSLRDQYNALIQYLQNKDISQSLDALRFPDLIAPTKNLESDALTGATLRSGKVISAISDGLNRGVYTPKSPEKVNLDRYLKTYENGTYRGSFQHKGEQQVGIEFKIKEGKIQSIEFKTLSYKGVNYLKDTSSAKIVALKKQYQSLIDTLLNKPLVNISNLYSPGQIVATQQVEMDALTGATLRSGKLVSAINDALNRGAYKKD